MTLALINQLTTIRMCINVIYSKSVNVIVFVVSIENILLQLLSINFYIVIIIVLICTVFVKKCIGSVPIVQFANIIILHILFACAMLLSLHVVNTSYL